MVALAKAALLRSRESRCFTFIADAYCPVDRSVFFQQMSLYPPEISMPRLFAVLSCIAIVSVASVMPALAWGATVQRTFVASTGVDTNTYALTAPCRTFAAAQAQTNSGGEIIVLDSAGYGPVAVSKSLSIIAPEGVYAGISVFSGDGVTIATPGIDVVLKGLTINGQGGTNGIHMTSGNSLKVLNTSVSNIISGGSGYGIFIETPAAVSVCHSNFSGNDRAIFFTRGAQGTVSNVTVDGGEVGLAVNTLTQTRDTLMQVSDAVVNNAKFGLSAISYDPTYKAKIQATRVQVHNSSQIGFDAEQQNGRMTLANCVSTDNYEGARATQGAVIYTLQDNVLMDNVNNLDIAGGLPYGGSTSTVAKF